MEAKLSRQANLHCRVDGDVYEAMRRKAFTEHTTHQQIVNDALRAYLANYLVTEEPS